MSTLLEIQDLQGVPWESFRAHLRRSMKVEQGACRPAGTSGSGKSTLLNLIAGLDRATVGTLTISGRIGADVERRVELASPAERRQFSSFNFISTMTASGTSSFDDARRRGSPSTPAREGPPRRDRLRRLHHRPKEMSGGEQQRVAIARALANRPQLLLADEPTGNLDSRTSADIMALLKQLNERDGKTIIMVTHDAALARTHAHRVITLLDGAIVSDARS